MLLRKKARLIAGLFYLYFLFHVMGPGKIADQRINGLTD